MNYSQYAIATSPENLDTSVLITPQDNETKMLKKALLVERFGKEYDYI